MGNTDYAANRGHEDIEEMRRQVKDLTDRYGSMAQSKLQHERQMLRGNMGEVEQQIRDRPMQAAVIAAGFGFLTGALLGVWLGVFFRVSHVGVSREKF
ncbi:MAG: hypothetical protein WBX25_33170 [Rhodomicrobium sp.]